MMGNILETLGRVGNDVGESGVEEHVKVQTAMIAVLFVCLINSLLSAVQNYKDNAELRHHDPPASA